MEKAQRNQIAVKFQGPTGSGKTSLAEAFCEHTQQPHFVMNMKGSTTSEELVGAFVPNTETGGSTYVWKDGIIVRALKYSQMWRETTVTRTTKGKGKKAQVSYVVEEKDPSYAVDRNMLGLVPDEDIIGEPVQVSKRGDELVEELTVKEWPKVMLTIEEINFSPEELMSVWFSLMDARRNIVLNEKDGEVIKAGKFLSVNATMNPDYIGTNQLNDALNDRFLIKLNVEYSIKTENMIIQEQSEKFDFTVNDVLFLREFVKRVRKGKTEADCDSNISTRTIGTYLINKGIFGDAVAKESMLNAVHLEDRDFVEHMYNLSKDSAEDIELDDYEMEGIDLSKFRGYEPEKNEPNKTREEKAQEAVDEDVPF